MSEIRIFPFLVQRPDIAIYRERIRKSKGEFTPALKAGLAIACCPLPIAYFSREGGDFAVFHPIFGSGRYIEYL
jgi:hypothetical protein